MRHIMVDFHDVFVFKVVRRFFLFLFVLRSIWWS